MSSILHERTLYTNKAIQYIAGEGVIEYDIRSAGFNICKQFGLLPEEKIRELEELDKKERHVAIGKLQREDKTLSEKLKEGFAKCREAFFRYNNVTDDDILSIKKDAIFIIGKRYEHLRFGKYIEFVPKHTFHSYIYLNDCEFYIGEDELACKGIKDELLPLHRDYMLDLITEYVNLLRLSNTSKQLEFIKEVAVAYRNKKLESGYYRELNNQSLFRPIARIAIMENTLGYTDFNLDLKYLDISYNYTHYIIPMYQILV